MRGLGDIFGSGQEGLFDIPVSDPTLLLGDLLRF
jgi:hypothetical protein